MEKDEKITRLISEMMADYRADRAEYNAQIEKGKQLASMMLFNLEKMAKAEDGKRVIYEAALQAFASELFEWYESQKAANADNIKQWREDIKPIIDMMRKYQQFADSYNSDQEEAEAEEMLDMLPSLPEAVQNEIKIMMNNPPDKQRAIIYDSPLLDAVTRSKNEKDKKIAKPINLSRRDGNYAIVNSGYVEGIERSLLKALGKCIYDGQITSDGRPFASMGQIYRALRGGGEQSPTKAQKEELLKALREMENPDRKIDFDLAEAIKIYEGVDFTGGKVRILSFDELRLKIRGQADTVAVFDRTPALLGIAKYYGTYETIPQHIERVLEEIWTLKIDNGETIKGTERDCKKKIARLGITKANILQANSELKPMNLRAKRIALRDEAYSKVWKYMRALGAKQPKLLSNKINYKNIFEVCGIGNTYNQKDRAKDALISMFKHLQRNEVIDGFKEYTNRGDKETSGIEFYINNENFMIGE